jgi:hypothetical protein
MSFRPGPDAGSKRFMQVFKAEIVLNVNYFFHQNFPFLEERDGIMKQKDMVK